MRIFYKIDKAELYHEINVNSSSQTGFKMSGQQKIQTLLKVRQGQYKTFFVILCHVAEIRLKMSN